LYAIGYMKNHEHHAPATASSTNFFFFILISFLGLMNGLVLVDNMKWLAIFWEGTTLCSFFLIGHDGTAEARQNARTALVLNSVGGAAMSLASALIAYQTGEEALSRVTGGAVVLLPVALLALATFTKSAQLPFQSWLLGAMVAPTPVSALLHSSTMVKAGSYLILRLAPAFAETKLATVIALAGAFTFAVTSAMAISQSNGKRVLAYSTIANLGLIVACAGIGSPLAYSAALIILVFHAVTKALLFLCVGTIEQTIGSREIEDMSGIMFKMPMTTTIAAVGMVSMIMPPFGMLLGKWMAIESAAYLPLVLFLLVIGSALTVFFWVKWIGRIITTSHHEAYVMESLPRSMSTILLVAVLAVVGLGCAAAPVYHYWIKPAVAAFPIAGPSESSSLLVASVDLFMRWPMITILAVVIGSAVISLLVARKGNLRAPFLCGENAGGGHRNYEFVSSMDQNVQALVTSYYLSPIFGEGPLTKCANLVAVLILLSMFATLGML